MPLPRKVHAVIFDLDGLIFDTESLYRDAMISAARESGHQEYEKAISYYQRALEERPHASWIYRHLTSSLSGAGRIDEAKQAYTKMLQAYPDLTVSKARRAMVYSAATLDRIAENLRKLGLPE